MPMKPELPVTNILINFALVIISSNDYFSKLRYVNIIERFMAFKSKVQVSSKNYFDITYDTNARWNSYWYQIYEVVKLRPKRLLEIGIGNKTVSDYLKKVGVIITDSKTTPLRWGTSGVAISYSGFSPLKNYIGSPDIFGKEMPAECSGKLFEKRDCRIIRSTAGLQIEHPAHTPGLMFRHMRDAFKARQENFTMTEE